MPASHERVAQRSLSGTELKKIILKDVAAILERDGMFSNNIAYSRVAYETRITLHLDNPSYPEHVSLTMSKSPSKQEIAGEAPESSMTAFPLDEGGVDIVAIERQRQILSPNMARVENDMPLQVQKPNLNTGHVETVEQKFVGDMPDPKDVGNIYSDVSKSLEEQTKSKGRRGK